MRATTVKQTRGRILDFYGDRLCSSEYDVDDGSMRVEVYLTAGGSYIAVSSLTYADTGNKDVRAAVIEKVGPVIRERETEGEIEEYDEAKQEMRLAVLDFFAWAQPAKDMVKEIGWSFRQVVP